MIHRESYAKIRRSGSSLKLAFIGSIKDEILQTEELAAELVTFMNKNYPGVLESKYNVEEDADPYGMIARIAESRHCLVRGNEMDTEKASVLLMDVSVTDAWED